MAWTELQRRNTVQIPGTQIFIPWLGFGVYKIRGDACRQACSMALQCGYRHIDSAQLYRNESAVREALVESSIRREEVFLTTKMSRAQTSLAATYDSALRSVNKLGGDGGYVDLFLIHIPSKERAVRERIWAALEMLYDEGKVRAIGVSNFHIHHLQEMKEYARIWPPHVNQIELHPWCQQRELVKYCKDNEILIQAYSPLVAGSKFQDPTLRAIAAKHGKSPAQVLIRYSLQKGWVPLPKSKTSERIQANADVCDFMLDEADMTTLDELDEGPLGACFPANVG